MPGMGLMERLQSLREAPHAQRPKILEEALRAVDAGRFEGARKCSQALGRAVELLPAPDPQLFSDLDGSPAPPEEASAAAAAEWARSVAAHLLLLARLVEALEPEALGLTALLAPAAEEGERVAGPLGGLKIVEIAEEADGGGGRGDTSSTAVGLLLAAAHYAPAPDFPRPWAPPGVAGAASGLLAALAAKFSGAVRAEAGGDAEEAGEQGLVATALPGAIEALRPIVSAHAAHTSRPSTRLQAYTGPGTFERAMAACQLTLLLSRLHGPALGRVLLRALPCALDCAADPAPAVQSCGMRAVCHAVHAAPAAALLPFAAPLLASIRKAAAGCDERAWPAAAEAAVAVALALRGGEGGAAGCVGIFEVLLEEGARHSHKPQRAAVWLRHVPTLFPALGLLPLVARLSTLAPLLLEWCSLLRGPARAAALGALKCLLEETWPRVPAHAPAIWAVLQAVQLDEAHLSGTPRPEVLSRLRECGVTLWCAGGPAFQESLRASPAVVPDCNGGSLREVVLEAVAAAGEGSGTAGQPGRPPF